MTDNPQVVLNLAAKDVIGLNNSNNIHTGVSTVNMSRRPSIPDSSLLLYSSHM